MNLIRKEITQQEWDNILDSRELEELEKAEATHSVWLAHEVVRYLNEGKKELDQMVKDFPHKAEWESVKTMQKVFEYLKPLNTTIKVDIDYGN